MGKNSPSPKRVLKPISPNKNGSVTVGKLSFLQSDNIDEHFEHIHSNHEEIKDSLQQLDLQTRQTHADLGQLFDRLKHNNLNLNKLLSSIGEYSREVTEEGNATKTDVGRIIDILNELKGVQNSAELARFEQAIADLAQKVGDSSERLTTIGEQASGIAGVKAQLEELQLLPSQNLELLSAQIEQLKETIEGLDTRKTLPDATEEKTAALQRNYDMLQLKYSRLEDAYQHKYNQFLDLESKYVALREDALDLETEIGNIDISKYEKVHQIHSDKVRDLHNQNPLLQRKRVISLPFHKPADEGF